MSLAGGPGTFAVTFTAPEKKCVCEGVVVFHTDAEDESRFEVRVRGSSTGVFTVKPEMLCLSESVDDRGAEASVRIDASGCRRITAVEIGPSGAERACPFHIRMVTHETADNASQATITVAFVSAEADAVVSQGTLAVYLGGEVLKIPIVATRSPRRVNTRGPSSTGTVGESQTRYREKQR
jgi:hypothetical protein